MFILISKPILSLICYCLVNQIHEEGGVHFLEDGHYWLEVPGLDDGDSDNEQCTLKANRKIQFSTSPIKVSNYLIMSTRLKKMFTLHLIPPTPTKLLDSKKQKHIPQLLYTVCHFRQKNCPKFWIFRMEILNLLHLMSLLVDSLYFLLGFSKWAV